MKKKGFEVYILKVALKYDKRIWRKIEIAASQTLDDLHDAVYRAFDRYDEHLYSFYFCDNPTSKSRNRHINAIEYKAPQCFASSIYDAWDKPKGNDASKAKLYNLQLKVTQKFEYLFDFGDSWWHEITFEGSDRRDTGHYPRTIKSNGESPPQYPDYDDDDCFVGENVVEIATKPEKKKPKKRSTAKKSSPAKKKKEKIVKKQKTDDNQPDLFSWADKN